MANVKDLIAQKRSKSVTTDIALKDINRDLILSLFSVSLFGKEANDSDVLSIILGMPEEEAKAKAAAKKPKKDSLKTCFNEKKAKLGKDLKRAKNGYLMHGTQIILEPNS